MTVKHDISSSMTLHLYYIATHCKGSLASSAIQSRDLEEQCRSTRIDFQGVMYVADIFLPSPFPFHTSLSSTAPCSRWKNTRQADLVTHPGLCYSHRRKLIRQYFVRFNGCPDEACSIMPRVLLTDERTMKKDYAAPMVTFIAIQPAGHTRNLRLANGKYKIESKRILSLK